MPLRLLGVSPRVCVATLPLHGPLSSWASRTIARRGGDGRLKRWVHECVLSERAMYCSQLDLC
eukprot:scaffold752_cov322-Pavlova_lutheri.AAC.57